MLKNIIKICDCAVVFFYTHRSRKNCDKNIEFLIMNCFIGSRKNSKDETKEIKGRNRKHVYTVRKALLDFNDILQTSIQYLYKSINC